MALPLENEVEPLAGNDGSQIAHARDPTDGCHQRKVEAEGQLGVPDLGSKHQAGAHAALVYPEKQDRRKNIFVIGV